MQIWVVLCWVLLAIAGAEDCPDGGKCASGHTCCNDPASGYECCPFDQAECCGDHMHCCPAGTICDSARSGCVNGSLSTPWAERASAVQPRLSKSFRMIKTYVREENDNVCPDQSRCPPEFSCLRALGKYACCPVAQGISCSDGKHCCPEGHQCSGDSRSCIRQEAELVTASEKVPAITTKANAVPPSVKEAAVIEETKGNVVPCNGTVACVDGTTCCKTKDGGWACCPLPEAVCCQDNLHCCPKGKTCNLIAQSCDDDTSSVPLVKKRPTIPRRSINVGDVACDSTTSCPDGSTCCKAEGGSWACCPLPEAVCCSDLVHCCPKGKTCDVAAQSCNDDVHSVPWVQKVPAIARQDVQVEDVKCDSTHSCPDGSTCCKTKEEAWACCPLPQAVCCEDHAHCCPTGTTCDLASLSCDGTYGSTPMKKKLPAFATPTRTAAASVTPAREIGSWQPEEKRPEGDGIMEAQEMLDPGAENEESAGVNRCDDHTSCPRDTTCCLIASSQKWGCCPLPEAVCCPDGDHCCPSHYKCDQRKTSCVKGEVAIPWYTKIPAHTSAGAPIDRSSVPCGGLNRCPEHTTCCQALTGEWGCCPMRNLETVPLTPVYLPRQPPRPGHLEQRDVMCEDLTRCKEGDTCCRMSSTAWGCCPSPNAVCCDDMKHCCPANHMCTEGGACTQKSHLHWHNWFLADKKRPLIV